MKPAQTRVSAQEDRPELRRSLGLREAIALGVGGTIGGGIFVLVGSAAGIAGPGALLAFGLAFLAALLIALPYAELACRYPEAGGGYAFARAVLGRFWGFLMGWIFWGAYLFISGYVTLGFGGYLNALTGIPVLAGSLGLIVACTIINIAGVRFSGQVQVGTIVLAIGGLIGFALLGLPHIRLGQFTPFIPTGVIGLLSAFLLTFLAFGGFDMVAAAGEEVDDPERNLPMAILTTLAIVFGIYLLVTFVALGTMSWERLGASSAPLTDAAKNFIGPAGAYIIALIAVLTTAATANAVLVVTSRISFAMARDELLPAPLAAVNAANSAPWVAILVSAIGLVLVALTQSIHVSTAIGGFLYVSHFIPPLLVLTKLRLRGGTPPAFRMPMPWVLLPLAFLLSLLLLVSSGIIGTMGGFAWVGLGFLVFKSRGNANNASL